MDAMDAPDSHRWTRLADELRATGLDVNVTTADSPSGDPYSIEFPTGDVLICIHDKTAHNAWAGWQVTVKGIDDGLIRATWPPTKRRTEVLATVVKARLAP